jgi:hypothetical protein
MGNTAGRARRCMRGSHPGTGWGSASGQQRGSGGGNMKGVTYLLGFKSRRYPPEIHSRFPSKIPDYFPADLPCYFPPGIPAGIDSTFPHRIPLDLPCEFIFMMQYILEHKILLDFPNNQLSRRFWVADKKSDAPWKHGNCCSDADERICAKCENPGSIPQGPKPAKPGR